MLNYLQHHGIKGQQWGVMHGPPYPINWDDKDSIATTIKKGTHFKRLSVWNEAESEGHAYVNYLKSDAHRYKGFFGARLKSINNGAKVYSIDMEAKDNMFSPSKKQRIENFIELYEKDPVWLGKQLGGYHKDDYHYATPLPKKFYEVQYSKLDGKELREKGYETFVRAIGGNVEVRDAYFEHLKSKGYSFVIDDCDANRFGKEPAIIFDRQKSTNYINQVEVVPHDIYSIWKQEGTYLPGGSKKIVTSEEKSTVDQAKELATKVVTDFGKTAAEQGNAVVETARKYLDKVGV